MLIFYQTIMQSVLAISFVLCITFLGLMIKAIQDRHAGKTEKIINNYGKLVTKYLWTSIGMLALFWSVLILTPSQLINSAFNTDTMKNQII